MTLTCPSPASESYLAALPAPPAPALAVTNGDPWYVLRVETGHESAAANHLSCREIDHYSPTYTQLRKYSHWRPESITRALFPGYIFARFPLTLKNLAIESPHVYDLVSFDNQPATIDDAEITRVKLLASAGPPTPWAKLIPGTRVRVLVGKMTGMVGVLAEIRNEYHFVVHVFMLGRSVSLKVDPAMLEAA